MALVTMKELLLRAQAGSIGVGAFNVGNMEMVKGAVQAAQELGTPIILQIAQVRLKHSPLEYMGPMMVQAAKEASVDIAVHLDHGLTLDTVQKALDLGFTSVMYDSSQYSFCENIQRTRQVAELAARYGATVEAELGVVGGSEGGDADHQVLYTDPEEAWIFCAETGIDALAVAIGNAHGNYRRAPKLAFDVLEQIRERTGIPLVLHGGSGICDTDFQKAIRGGITKINIATAGFQALTAAAGRYLCTGGPHTFFGLNEAMVQGTYENVSHHIRVFRMEEGSSGNL